MPYAEPLNLTSITGMFEYANSVTDNWYTLLIPITLMVIVFLSLKLKQFYTADCLMAAGFISTIVATFLRLAGFLTTFHLFFFIIATVLGAMLAFFTKKDT